MDLSHPAGRFSGNCELAMFQGSASQHPFSLERFFRWRCYQDYSGGIATDLFVHLCTAIHFLMDAKVCPTRSTPFWSTPRASP